ncbi:MAG: glycosyltransferase family 4 protein [Geminicoccaceae bacterium]
MVAACPFPHPRGTPIRILRMAEALAERGHEIHVVTYHLGAGDANAAFCIHRTRELSSYRHVAPGPTYKKLLLLDPLLTAKLVEVIGRFSIDVVHAHHYEGLLVSAGARLFARPPGRLKARLPVVYDAHTLLSSELSFYGLGLPAAVKDAIGRRLDRWLPRRADHVISVTNAIRTSLVVDGVVPSDVVTVIPNGVECERFAAGAVARAGSRNGARKVLFTGNLASYQGINSLLEAFAEVVRTRNDVRLTIAADSPFAPYEDRARELGVRHAIDVVPAPAFECLPTLLASADVAVNPRGQCAGMPVKLLNYMAASRPVVSFVGSAPGLEHRRTGWLVENGDIAAFARGIVTLLDDHQLAADLGRGARRYVEAHHGWPAAAKQIDEVYRKVLGAAP